MLLNFLIILGVFSRLANPTLANSRLNRNVQTEAKLPVEAKQRLQQADWSQILISQQPDLSFRPSTIYFADDFIKAVEQMVEFGVGSQKLWFGDGDPVYGLVSMAAFLAQAMKETIQYDACDENNWNLPNGYSAANACGQLGQAYDKYFCSGDESGLECEINPNKVVVAKTHAKWYGAPGPLFAAPKSLIPRAPRWNYQSPWCDPNQRRTLFTSDLDYVQAIAANNGSATCRMYKDQKAGGWELCNGQACPNDPAPSFNVPARTDVEGCYFWGRGVIQTTGICNYGKLNYYAGKKAADANRNALFPEIDFCANPEEICQNTKYPELKWFSGLFYWLNAVQDYDDGKFNYKEMLKKFVDEGFRNPGSDSGFIRGVSGIVNRGCADPPNCGTGPLDGGSDRAQNFEKVLRAFKLIGPGAQLPTRTATSTTQSSSRSTSSTSTTTRTSSVESRTSSSSSTTTRTTSATSSDISTSTSTRTTSSSSSTSRSSTASGSSTSSSSSTKPTDVVCVCPAQDGFPETRASRYAWKKCPPGTSGSVMNVCSKLPNGKCIWGKPKEFCSDNN